MYYSARKQRIKSLKQLG